MQDQDEDHDEDDVEGEDEIDWVNQNWLFTRLFLRSRGANARMQVRRRDRSLSTSSTLTSITRRIRLISDITPSEKKNESVNQMNKEFDEQNSIIRQMNFATLTTMSQS